jgi:uncharacterized protein YhdP
MRRLLLIAAVLALVAAAGGATVLFFLNRLVAANRESILQQASAAVGRPVSVERIAASLRGGVGVRLSKVRIADSPDFGGGDLLTAESLMAHLRIRPLLRGVLDFSRVDAERPIISVVRNRAGEWNFANLGGSRHTAGSAAPGVAGGSADNKAADTLLFIAVGNVAQGNIVVTDRSRQPPQVIAIRKLDLALADVGTTAPIRFQLVAAVDSEQPNVRVAGEVGPLLGGTGIPLSVNGTLGPRGSLRVDDLQANLTIIAGEAVEIARLDGRSCGGNLSMKGRYPLREEPLTLAGAFKGFDLGCVLDLASEGAAERISGSGDLQWDLKAAGASAEAIGETLAGTAILQASDGRVKDYNLAHELITRFAGVPGLAPLVSANLKAKYQRLLSDAVTGFQSLHATLQIAGQRLRSNDAQLIAPDFEVQASGLIELDGRIDAALTLLLSQSLSADIVADVKEASLLGNASGRLELPLRWRGRVTETHPEPDTKRLGGVLQRAVTSGAAQDLVGRLLGGKGKKQGEKDSGDALERRLQRLFRR